MDITEVRVKRLSDRSDRLRAFCSITIDDEFVVHDLRVIDGRKGLFVAMPSRKITDNCPSCSGKNHLRAQFCNSCGSKLDKDRARKRDKVHVDVAHPIVTGCRDKIKNAVLEAFKEEAEEEGEGTEQDEAPAGGYEDDEELSDSEMDFDSDEEKRDAEATEAEPESVSEEEPGTGPVRPFGEEIGQEQNEQRGQEQEKEKVEEEGEERQEESGFGNGIL